jgi:hypothetical protein
MIVHKRIKLGLIYDKVDKVKSEMTFLESTCGRMGRRIVAPPSHQG